TAAMKSKVLELMGFGNWENAQDTASLHISRAEKENVDIAHASILPVDNHELHLDTHIRFVISGQADKISAAYQQALLDHISLHKKMMSQPSIKE
ncbi:MAG: hypothetical protein IJ032_03815, partial [Clostridia bacterium]|nr:hypothetical protein [Clostridia bacterium]